MCSKLVLVRKQFDGSTLLCRESDTKLVRGFYRCPSPSDFSSRYATLHTCTDSIYKTYTVTNATASVLAALSLNLAPDSSSIHLTLPFNHFVVENNS